MLGLAFSGGKDSLACWHLYSKNNPVVFWVNTGKAYPETLEIVNEIRNQCDQFVEIKTDQQAQNDKEGLPSDIVPIDYTTMGIQCTSKKPVVVQSYLQCCIENIARPLMDAVKAHGVTQLIRGQRNSESHKSPSKNGAVVEGVKFIHPIEDWTDEQVFAFLKAVRPELPAHFFIKHSSLDCYDCTAYLEHSQDRIEWMQKKYPELHNRYKSRMAALQSAVSPLLPYFSRQNY